MKNYLSDFILRTGLEKIELLNLLQVEDIVLLLESAKVAILPERTGQAVPVDGGGLQADYHITELHGM